MTAINVLTRRDRVHMLTDGALYRSDGTVAGFGSKVLALPHLPAALAIRGAAFILPALNARIWDAFVDFDALKAEIVDRVRASIDRDRHLFALSDMGDRFEMFVAGWSAQAGHAEAFTLASFEQGGREPWRLIPIPGIVSPADQDFADQVGELELDLLSPDLDIARDGLQLLELQRGRPWRIEVTGRDAYVVGGFAELTTVSRDGISRRILRRWRDRIGEKIAPRAEKACAVGLQN